MFRIVPNPTFTADVPLSRPDSDTPTLVKFTFRHKTRRELEAYQRRAFDLAMRVDAPDAQEQYLAYVAEVVEGWIGIVDGDGKPLPFTASNLALLVQNFPSAGNEIVRFYGARLSHARAGN